MNSRNSKSTLSPIRSPASTIAACSAESFEKELNRARRYGLPLGIVILDLHRFKEVNDKYGHPRGDEVLRAAASHSAEKRCVPPTPHSASVAMSSLFFCRKPMPRKPWLSAAASRRSSRKLSDLCNWVSPSPWTMASLLFPRMGTKPIN